MGKVILGILSWVFLSFSYEECQNTIGVERALQAAKQYVGEVYTIRLSRAKKTGECFYHVRGKEGTATIDSTSGKLVRFYRSKN